MHIVKPNTKYQLTSWFLFFSYLSIYLSIYLFIVKKFHNQTLLNLVKRLGGTLIMNRLYKLLLSLILSPIFYFVFLKIYILLFCV